MNDFHRELKDLLNRYSIDNEMNTPDFVLVQYIRRCLDTWNETIIEWYKCHGKQLAILSSQDWDTINVNKF